MAEDPVGQVDLPRFVELIEQELLGGERKYTREEMVERVGGDIETARSRWRSLGFATTNDDERLYTDADVQANRDVYELQDVAGIDDDVMLAMTRIIGQTFARLASWQGQVVTDRVANDPELLAGGAEGVSELIGSIMPIVERLHDYVWRRQLSAYFARVAANAQSGEGIGTEVAMAVGFVDMAGFTTFTRQSSEADLRNVLTRFESMATDVVGTNNGQIVKTIGDEILFTVDRAADAAQIALTMVETAESDDVLPQVRAGVAYGPIVSRLGDVFGQPVNIASRLTSVARTGSVLVDQGIHDKVDDDESLRLHPLRPVNVRGYQHLKSWRLRRTPS
ncbi:adenylate/guanylate cyclase domain-containing protein [uncultured Jatrophihabitans sp.]|uniref:adenylate/guanylate cyclase domain-containing protein n=1 Tax=uncultured Jatrophihabitans sp. TaxID=1610747 RepID=UPI0035CC42D3